MAAPTKETFKLMMGEAIQQIRTKADLSQMEFSRRCGLHQSGVSRIEAGEQQITLYDFLRICDIMELDPGEVIDLVRWW